MQTDTNIEETLKTERRKIFHALNILPWVLLVIITGMIAFYFYKQSYHAPNAVEKVAPPTETVTSTNWITQNITNNIFVTNTVTKVVTNTVVNTNLITNTIAKLVVNTNVVVNTITNIVTNTKQILVTNTVVITNMVIDLPKLDAERKELENKIKDASDKAIHEMQVNAVSNNHAEWTVNVNGQVSFRWKDLSTETNKVSKSIHGISLPPDREYPFTVNNYSLAKTINLNIEEELSKVVITTIEAHFLSKKTVEDEAFKKELQKDLIMQIQKFFDGFETINKENIRR